MKDSQILDEVYNALKKEREKYNSQPQGWLFGDPLISFIEQEWQKRDDEDLRQQYNRNRPVEEHIHYPETVPSFSKSWYMDAKEMERHRGLEIGEDGTVKELK